MRPTLLLLVAVVGTAAPSSAGSSTFTEGFEGGTNRAAWSFIAGFDRIQTSGGNPGAWLRQPSFDTFAPILSNDPGQPSPFQGDFRAAGVARISLDARTDATTFGNPTGFEMSLLLRDTKGTAIPDDDDYAYFVGPQVPQPGEGWVHYDFAIPSSSTAAVPTGWFGGWAGDPENFRPGVDWNDVITSVDVVEVWWLDPRLFAIFRNWDVGVDNVAIELEALPATVTPRFSRANANSLTSKAAPVLGTVWPATLDCSGHASGLAALAGGALPSFGIPADQGELLLDPADLFFVLGLAHAGGPVDFAQPVPATPALCGTPVFVQGLCTGAPGGQLSNALDLVLGL